MLLRLSQNSYIRNYGPYTYVTNRLKDFDQVDLNGDVFLCAISRTPCEEAKILDDICVHYPETDCAIIRKDFNEFIKPLLEDGVLVAGATEKEIDRIDETFSYNVENPKTINRFKGLSKKDNDSDEVLPQKILDEYFLEHPTIFSLQVNITQACTERCIHCYVPDHDPIFLPYTSIKNVRLCFRTLLISVHF